MIRLWMAVMAARLVGWVSRQLGRGGSSLPGLVARRIDPAVLTKLTRGLSGGVMLVTGTNGKTTTAAIAAEVFRRQGFKIIHNQAGANLILGLSATMVQAERWKIYPRADIALLETDEASMARAAGETQPRAILVTNFFRDQLDRYGELSTTVSYVAQAVASLHPQGGLVLNADDPQVANLARHAPYTLFFGLELAGFEQDAGGYDVADARFCPRCGQALIYQRRYYAHLGWYHCGHCGWQRPTPEVAVTRWEPDRGQVHVRVGGERAVLPWHVPGVYNLYNLLAAVTLASRSGVAMDVIRAALDHFQPAFGRMEQFMLGEAAIWMTLVKNPVGFNQVLQAVAETPAGEKVALVLINDRYADGRDVSWLWDVDFEYWVGRTGIREWWVSGLRARDMAVRLKYAGVPLERIRVHENAASAFEALYRVHPGASVFIMPTYTALLDIRQYFTRKGYTRHFREG